MKPSMLLFLCFTLLLSLLPVSLSAQEPDVAASAAILMDAKTGRVLWEKNAHTPQAMASTTKIMTAVLALESGRENETVKVSKNATTAPRMKMYLKSGEEIRLGDLLLALMLESSNDAAIAIAEHLEGSVEAFCALMTLRAQQLGAKNTVYETPNGLDAENHHSTAYDLAAITRHALEVPGFIQLINTREAHFSSNIRSYDMVNKNRLLSEFDGANGVKTGFTGKAGHCFVGAAKRDDMQLISVVLASGWGDKGRSQKWVDTKEVLNYGFDNFSYKTVIVANEQAGKISLTRSRTTELDYVYTADLTMALSNEEKGQVEVKVNVPPTLQAPINKGDVLGQAEVYLNGQLYASIDLTATDTALRHDFKTSLEKILNQWLSQVLEEQIELTLPELPNFLDFLE